MIDAPTGAAAEDEAPADAPAEDEAPAVPDAPGKPAIKNALPTGRLEAFSDGVFAVAITLLIFNVDVPAVRAGGLPQALLDHWPVYASYVVSFVTIGIMWVNHHVSFARIAMVDRPLLFLNLLLLMAVVFVPFPTRLVGTYILQGGVDARAATFVYATTMTIMSLAFSGIWIYAVQRGLLHPKRMDSRAARMTIPRFSIGIVLYAATMVLALISPVADVIVFAVLAGYYVFDQQVS